LAMPIWGLAKSSSPSPTARSIPREAVASIPSVTTRERGLISGVEVMAAVENPRGRDEGHGHGSGPWARTWDLRPDCAAGGRERLVSPTTDQELQMSATAAPSPRKFI